MGAALKPFQPIPPAERELMLAEICARLAEGEPLTEICREPGMPSVTAVWNWGEENAAHAEAIARARAAGFDAIALSAMRIVDGTEPAIDPKTGKTLQSDANRDKARAEVRLKLLAKWDPKRYGEAFQLRHADANGEKLDTTPMVRELMGLMRRADGSEAAVVEGSATVVAPKAKGPPAGS